MSSSEVSIWPKNVQLGVGSVARLPVLMRSYGCNRAMVICGQSVASGPMLESVRNALGPLYAGVFAEVRSHTPLPDVQRAAELCMDLHADTVISVGGGSAIDAAKGVIICCAAGGDPRPYAMGPRSEGGKTKPMPISKIRHIAVPTTAGSGSDVMPSAGIRDPSIGKKILFWDQGLIPDATVLDPQMAVYAGGFLTAASGMTAVARAMESIYSKHRNQISTGLALHALRLLNRALPLSVNEPNNLQARQDCQVACILASTAAVNAMASVVHAIGHVVGGRFQLQHGVSHAILLAPIARRYVPLLGDDVTTVLQAFGYDGTESVASPGELIATALERLHACLPLPKRLRELGLTEADIPVIAESTLEQHMLDNVPRPTPLVEIQQILEEAW